MSCLRESTETMNSCLEIEYDHSSNLHTLDTPRVALPLIFSQRKPKSLLDVGCGTGTWLNAALEFGISDLYGVDGIDCRDTLPIPATNFRQQDFTVCWELGRHFDAALCLEVGEHLEARYAATLVDTLTKHASLIVFSAACPGQPGQHHVNGQWPCYWQRLFNDHGFVCSDEVRWRLWNEDRIEAWYRQNIFVAQDDAQFAGKEPRICSVIHPALLGLLCSEFPPDLRPMEKGLMPVKWYWGLLLKAMTAKLARRLQRRWRSLSGPQQAARSG
jgi:SAM-dependent methyltransferase